MIPIKNKKKSLEVTVDEMRNFSLVYIEKYAPSKQQLKTYLLKKYLKTKIPNINKKNINDLIDVVLEDLEKSNVLSEMCKASELQSSTLLVQKCRLLFLQHLKLPLECLQLLFHDFISKDISLIFLNLMFTCLTQHFNTIVTQPFESKWITFIDTKEIHMFLDIESQILTSVSVKR